MAILRAGLWLGIGEVAVIGVADGAKNTGEAIFGDSNPIRKPANEDNLDNAQMEAARALEIPGFLTARECAVLYLLARRACYGVLEIGAWQGRSTVCLAAGAGERVPVYSVDNFTAPPGVRYSPSSADILLTNLRASREGRPDRRLQIPTLIALESTKAANSFRNAVDLLFVDADHRLEWVRQDIASWSKHVMIGGRLAFHDYGHPRWPGVQQAVDEWLERSAGSVVFECLVERLAVLKLQAD